MLDSPRGTSSYRKRRLYEPCGFSHIMESWVGFAFPSTPMGGGKKGVGEGLMTLGCERRSNITDIYRVRCFLTLVSVGHVTHHG